MRCCVTTELHATGSGSCPVVVQVLAMLNRRAVLREVVGDEVGGTSSGSCPKVVPALAVLNLRVLLPESLLVKKMGLWEAGCEERQMKLAQDRVQ